MSLPDNPFQHIVLPSTQPSAWPPAPIYWFIAVISIVLIVLALLSLRAHLKQQKTVSMALKQLNKLTVNESSFAELNQLLKALALHYYPRTEVAGLSGKTWYTFIEQHNATEQVLFESMDKFCQRLYQTSSPVKQQDINAARSWIKSLPKQVKLQQKKLIEAGVNDA